MSANGDLITAFYSAFQRRDAEGMVACYAPDVRFSDPVFVTLIGEEARGMWRMLCARGKDLRIDFHDVQADDRHGTARWEAWYTFGATGRTVHNIIEARFSFANGLIATHTDTFSFYRWARQALGPTGLLLGWTPFLAHRVHTQAMASLHRFLQGGR